MGIYLASGLRRLRPAGRAAVVGTSKEKAIALPLAQLNPQDLTISLVNRYAHTWPIAIELVSSARVHVTPLITHHFRLEQTEEALTLRSHVQDGQSDHPPPATKPRTKYRIPRRRRG
jgi:L-iditol 2-dehydrogenase